MNKEQFLEKARKLEIREVDLPNFGIVHLREPTAGEAEAYFSRLRSEGIEGGQIPKHLRAELIAKCLVDDNGNRMFVADPPDYDVIASFGSRLVQQLYEIAAKLASIEDREIEASLKNSETATSA